MELSEAVRTSYITAGLTEDHIEFLCNLGQMIDCPAGTEIMRQFDVDRDLFILAEGSAYIHGVLWEPLGRVKPGMTIGEVSFLDGRPRSGTVIATSDSKVVHLAGEAVLERMSHFPELRAQILWNISQVLCARLRTANQHIVALMALEDADLSSSGQS